MDHKQLATPFGRRTGLPYPNRKNCSLIERPRKPRFKKWMCCTPDAGTKLSQHSFQKSPYAPLFSRIAFVLAPRGTVTFAPLFLRLDLAGNLSSSSCQYGPRLTVLRPRPADNDTRPRFSEAGELLLRNLPGPDARRENGNRVPVRSNRRKKAKMVLYSREPDTLSQFAALRKYPIRAKA
jgi:hypothetical protein